MRKILLIILCMCFSVVFAIDIIESSSPNNNNQTNAEAIGGWSPMFFTSYDIKKVNGIVTMIKEKRIKDIKITYPASKSDLAFKIARAIQKDTDQVITINKFDIKDTTTIKYNHSQVVVTLYYGSRIR